MKNNDKAKVVHLGDRRILTASLNFQKLQEQNNVIWKKKVYTEDEIKKNPYKLLFAIKNEGDIYKSGKDLFVDYEFKKSDVGKYIKFISYVNEFSTKAQCIAFYVEENIESHIRIRKVERIDSTDEVFVGSKLKLKVEYSVPENKVSEKTKKNVKWIVKVEDQEEDLLMQGDLIIKGGEIEVIVPEEWNTKNIVLMPYLFQPTEDVSCSLNIQHTPACGGTWVEPIGTGRYQVKKVFLERDTSNRIFYLDANNNIKTIGYSLTPYSFLYTEAKLMEDWEPKGVIDINNHTGREYFNGMFKGTNMTSLLYLIYYMINAIGYAKYDFKRTEGKDEYIGQGKEKHSSIESHYRGMPLNNILVPNDSNGKVYASARDIGNIHAGIVAGSFGMTWEEARKGFDALQTLQKWGYSTSKFIALGYTKEEYIIILKRFHNEVWSIEEESTQYAQRFGFIAGSVLAEEHKRVKGYNDLHYYQGGRTSFDYEKVYSKIKIITKNEIF